MSFKLKRHKSNIIRLIVGLFAAFLLSTLWVWYNTAHGTHEAPFAKINQDYKTFDTALEHQFAEQVSYDQSTECYYWKDPHEIFETNRGPLGCFKNRAYYIKENNPANAHTAASTIAAMLDTTFNNVQQPGSKTIINTSNNYLGGNTPVATSIPGACNFSLWYPATTPYLGLPDRHDTSSLMVVVGCGGDAAKAYYPYHEE